MGSGSSRSQPVPNTEQPPPAGAAASSAQAAPAAARSSPRASPRIYNAPPARPTPAAAPAQIVAPAQSQPGGPTREQVASWAIDQGLYDGPPAARQTFAAFHASQQATADPARASPALGGAPMEYMPDGQGPAASSPGSFVTPMVQETASNGTADANAAAAAFMYGENGRYNENMQFPDELQHGVDIGSLSDEALRDVSYVMDILKQIGVDGATIEPATVHAALQRTNGDVDRALDICLAASTTPRTASSGPQGFATGHAANGSRAPPQMNTFPHLSGFAAQPSQGHAADGMDPETADELALALAMSASEAQQREHEAKASKEALRLRAMEQQVVGLSEEQARMERERAQLDDLHLQTALLKSQLESMEEGANQQLLDDLNKLQRDRVQLERAIEEQRAAARAEAQVSSAAVAQTAAAVDQHKEMLRNLDAQVQAHQRQLQERNAEVAAQERKLQERDAEVEAHQRQLQERNAEVAAQERKLRERDAEVQAHQRQLQERKAEVEAHRRQLQERAEEAAGQQQKVTDLTNQLKQISEGQMRERQAAQEELERATQAGAAEVERLRKQLDERDQLTSQELEAQREAYMSARVELEKHKQVSSELEQQRNDFVRRQEELEARIAAGAEQEARGQAQVATLAAECEALRKQLIRTPEQPRASLAPNQEDIWSAMPGSSDEGEVAKMAEQISKLDSALQDARRNLAERSKSQSVLKESLQAAHAEEMERMKKSLKEQAAASKAAKSKAERLAKDLADAKQQAQENQDKVKRMQHEAKSAKSHFQAKAQQWDDEKSELQSTVMQAQDEIARLKAELAAAKAHSDARKEAFEYMNRAPADEDDVDEVAAVEGPVMRRPGIGHSGATTTQYLPSRYDPSLPGGAL